jgi:predicted Rossmann-fold nucleotide-binding protein
MCGLGYGETIQVDDMHTRKLKFLQLSNAFLCLPGGFGTMEEILECITWKQLGTRSVDRLRSNTLIIGIHNHPIVILDPNGFFDHLKSFFNHAKDQGSASF